MKHRREGPDRRRLSAQQLLKAVPFANAAMKVHRQADGGILTSIPVRRPRYLVPPLSWILPFSSERRVQLDTVGAAVLDLCDGQRNLESVIEKFAADHKLSFREAQLPVAGFLRQLVDRGILAIVGLEEDANEQ